MDIFACTLQWSNQPDEVKKNCLNRLSNRNKQLFFFDLVVSSGHVSVVQMLLRSVAVLTAYERVV